jgi:hypothetical protein
MTKKIIGWAVEHVNLKGEVDQRIVRNKESEADVELKETIEADIFPETGTWRKAPVYAQ